MAPSTRVLMPGACAVAQEDDLLDVIEAELKASVTEELEEWGKRQCEQVDCHVASALRQLPPHVRALPASQAFRMFSDWSVGTPAPDRAVRPRRSKAKYGVTDGNVADSSGLHRSRSDFTGSRTMSPSIRQPRNSCREERIPSSGRPPTGQERLPLNLESRLEALASLQAEIQRTYGGLEGLSAEQRRSVMGQLTGACAGLVPAGHTDSGSP